MVMGAEIKGLNQFLRDMKNAPPELQRELRRRAKGIAEPIAAEAKTRARTRQQRAASGSIRAVADRIPVVKAGGGRRFPSTTATARSRGSDGRFIAGRAAGNARMGDVYFGADFGSNRLRQFQRKRKGGTMIFQAVKGNRKAIADQYLEAVEDVFKGR